MMNLRVPNSGSSFAYIMRRRDKDPLFKAYCAQSVKRTKCRLDRAGNPIEFRLTFEEWLKIWEDSGHLHERGRGKGKYCMSRIDDLGHYEIGNVYIQEFGANSREAAKFQPCTNFAGPRTPKHILNLSRARSKVHLTLEQIDEIRAQEQRGYGISGQVMKSLADKYQVSVTTIRRIWDRTFVIEGILRDEAKGKVNP